MCTVQFTLAILATHGEYVRALNEFDHVRLDRNFTNDRGRSSIRLACQKLRLTRWASTVGIHGGPSEGGLLQLHGRGSQEDIEEAEESLISIAERFAECRAKARALDEQEPRTRRLGIDDDSPDTRSLLERMHGLTKARYRREPREHVEWFLCDREDFEELLQGIRKVVTELVEGWPGYKEEQRKLCRGDAEVLAKENGISQLAEVAAEEDPDLAEALVDGGVAVSLVHSIILHCLQECMQTNFKDPLAFLTFNTSDSGSQPSAYD